MESNSKKTTGLTRPLHDLHPPAGDLLSEVLTGLTAPQKTLPCKYFYDQKGSQLFDKICELAEYYPTRTEISILDQSAREISDKVGPKITLIELGSGSSSKTENLLQKIDEVQRYVPIDISREHLMEASERIAGRFPHIEVWPICADMNEEVSLPDDIDTTSKRVLFFPGSTVGNFEHESQIAFLSRMRRLCANVGDQLLIGIDLIKDIKTLEAAYNDAEGVTSEFNLNILQRINTELGADFKIDHFIHRAVFNKVKSRIEMHLVSVTDQVVQIQEEKFQFDSNESICTEYSHKFTIDGFVQMAQPIGWELEQAWTDKDQLFAVLLLRLGEL